MLDEIFLDKIKPVIEVFGRERFTKEFISHAQRRTKDLSTEEMAQLCELLIDNCERAPSIVKIVGYAAIIKARRKSKLTETVNQETLCYQCNDLGVVRVQSEKHGDLLMRCGSVATQQNQPDALVCRTQHFWDLPKWQDSYADQFKKSIVPAIWFKPSPESSFEEKRDGWRAKIRISEIKMKELGYAAL